MQQFASASPGDDDEIIRVHQREVAKTLGQKDGVLIGDGSDFPKQGQNSVGVARQHCGALGKTANCQAGMFLAYASELGHISPRFLAIPWSFGDNRNWRGWHPAKGGTMTMLSHHFLVRMRVEMGDEAPALTVSQARQLLNVSLPKREFDAEAMLDEIQRTQQQNYAAYHSHRKRWRRQKIALST